MALSFSNYPPPCAANAARATTAARLAGSNIRIVCDGGAGVSVEKAIRIPRTQVLLTHIRTIRESGGVHPVITLYSRSGKLVATAADAAFQTHTYTPGGTPEMLELDTPIPHEAKQLNTGEGDDSQTDAYVWVVVANAAAWTGTVQFSGQGEPAES